MAIAMILALLMGQLFVPAPKAADRCKVEERRPCGGIIRH